MIDITICDDNKILLDNIKKEILFKSNKIGRNVNINTFTDGKELLDLFNKNNNSFDIVFLDIDMPNIDGFKIAEYIRKRNSQVIIIFLTSMENLVYDSFKYLPLRFIRKNQLGLELGEGLVAAFNQLDRNNNYYTFKTTEGTIKLMIKDIMYIECILRKIHINIFNKQYQIVGYKFCELVKSFENKNFVMIHRTIIVNMNYIFSIGKNEIELDNGKKLNLSRYRVSDVKHALAKFV